jgi:hypothetical protein
MRITFTLDAEIIDVAQLYRAAVERAKADHAPGEYSDADIVDMLGEKSAPDISACVVMLLDPGSLPGCDIDGSSVEEY